MTDLSDAPGARTLSDMSDVKMPSRRQPGPRALVLAVLRDVTRRSKLMVKIWNESQTVYDHGGGTHRRRADEKIENQVSSWTLLARFARSVAADLDKMAEYADSRRAALLAEAEKEAAK